jgi:hypothetical protein
LAQLIQGLKQPFPGKNLWENRPSYLTHGSTISELIKNSEKYMEADQLPLLLISQPPVNSGILPMPSPTEGFSPLIGNIR